MLSSFPFLVKQQKLAVPGETHIQDLVWVSVRITPNLAKSVFISTANNVGFVVHFQSVDKLS